MAGKAERIALFIDFETMESGVKKQSDNRVDLNLITSKLDGRGSLGVQRAYADWGELSSYKQALIQAGFELIECPAAASAGNATAIKLAVDAVDIALRPGSAETFAIASSNTDLAPLVQKLKEIGKSVTVIMGEGSKDGLLKSVSNGSHTHSSQSGPAPAKKPQRPQRIPNEALKTIAKILTEHPDYSLEAGALREELVKKISDFDETVYGSTTFPELLEFIQRKKLLPLKVNTKGDSCIVSLIDEKAKKEKEEQWEERPMTEKEWEAFMEAVEDCINEGAGRANQGKLWIINAYLHRKRVDGVLPLTNNVLFSSLQALNEYGALRRTENDCYLLTEDYQYKKEDFLDELFGVEIDEEFYDESEEDKPEEAEEPDAE